MQQVEEKVVLIFGWIYDNFIHVVEIKFQFFRQFKI